MQWIPHKELHAENTISAMQFSSGGLLARTSWDCTLKVSSTSSSASLHSSFSRPLLALAWTGSSQLWFGGGENRVCLADIDYLGNSATYCDIFATGGPVLGIASNRDDAGCVDSNSVIACTPDQIVTVDHRINKVRVQSDHGGVDVDVLGNYVCIARHGASAVFDLRNTVVPMQRHAIPSDMQPLKVKWLEPNVYAVSGTESHVAVVSSSPTTQSYVFKSNRQGVQPRPIYSLARKPGTKRTLATGGGDNHVFVWDYGKRKLFAKVTFPLACTALAYSADGEMAVGLSNDEWSSTVAKYSQPSRARVMVTKNT